MSRRMDRVNVVLRQEISRVLTSELKDPRLSTVVSVTHVESSADLKHATVFISVLGDKDAKELTLTALKSAAGFIHRRVRKQISLRSVPALRFRLDESIEQGAELSKLISEVSPGPDTPMRRHEPFRYRARQPPY